MITSIARHELQARLNRGDSLILAEALPEPYYSKEHLPSAVHLPLDRIDELAPTRLPDKLAPIVVYCAGQTCANSQVAARRLVALGYTAVRVYEGGKEDWKAAGLPTEGRHVAVVQRSAS